MKLVNSICVSKRIRPLPQMSLLNHRTIQQIIRFNSSEMILIRIDENCSTIDLIFNCQMKWNRMECETMSCILA